ncbi:MAG: AbrB/MazE/SpoVT family DNA-binding domain-containing protein [Erysipelotrichaceae bacterium]|nr:AbrB/MazE/SpoVT family DNA-binding domain-containing protein [Erysipelotrichaceae bacterium]
MMKATGIVRRVDELGRLVIPKEMRKKYHLNEGDSVEFYINERDEIVIRKFSLFEDWEQTTQVILETLSKTVQNPILFMNKEGFQLCGREVYQEFLNQKLHPDFTKMGIVYTNQQFQNIKVFQDDSLTASGYIFPIVVYGDWVGSLVVLELRSSITNCETQTVDAFRNYLIRTMEQ